VVVVAGELADAVRAAVHDPLVSWAGMSHCRQHAGRRRDRQSPGRQDICHFADTSGGGPYAGRVHLGLIALRRRAAR